MDRKIKDKLAELHSCKLSKEEIKQLRISQVISLAGLPIGIVAGLSGYKNLSYLGFKSMTSRGLLFAGCVVCGGSSACCITSSVAISRLKRLDLPLTCGLYELDELLARQLTQLQQSL